jgi:hypothetical protein
MRPVGPPVGVLDVVDMHKNIGAALIRQDEAKSTIWVEEI